MKKILYIIFLQLLTYNNGFINNNIKLYTIKNNIKLNHLTIVKNNNFTNNDNDNYNDDNNITNNNDNIILEKIYLEYLYNINFEKYKIQYLHLLTFKTPTF